ncbi:Low temperature viability protein-domain-containing protein [Halteromyces radiatus]|uniref:Low temperature viability protein-domain-containing protein n=1 Tax=Halteromyces radiatus TaxID=101107 RepID=UPI00221F0C56|nr:Low temperature viability protein-domain-containing protein [Halteromyces radiatus]KAI8078762.1 Low temperature viability protein-domain-containing protein [Halteromyces radiatus]
MPKKSFIDRKTAKHFHVVHRSQKDPLINDSEASARVLQEVVPPNLLKHKTPEELKKINAKPTKMTQDEIDQRVGQAALYGVYFDDAEYDYMQHMKPIGAVDAVFLEAPGTRKEKSKKGGDGLLLREDVEEKADIFEKVNDKKNPNLFEMPSGVLPSNVELEKGVMNQPTGLEGGLQPDMDPRLREVLEALEDEEYVEDDLDNFFDDLNDETLEPYDPDEEEYEDYSDEEYEDYEEDGPVDPENYDWQAAFNKFKRNQTRAGSDDEFDDIDDRQSKGTGFSISSSAMHRTTQLRTLDDRFDRIEEEYMQDDDDDDEYYDGDVMEEREDFDAILDDFLEKYEVVGNKLAPRLEGDDSAQKLDAIRGAFDTLHILEEEEKREQQHQERKERGTSKTREPAELWARPEQRKRQTWDCQSVISTYSNLENHPQLISDRGPKKKISIDPKTGMPILVEDDRRKQKIKNRHHYTQSDEEDLLEEEEDEEEEERVNLGERRSKAETKEEKKQRKQAIKDAKKVK